jgi:hypothetical protein
MILKQLKIGEENNLYGEASQTLHILHHMWVQFF